MTKIQNSKQVEKLGVSKVRGGAGLEFSALSLFGIWGNEFVISLAYISCVHQHASVNRLFQKLSNKVIG